ncbi:hypothetical protein AKO1_009562 [Acrasis kona]|uniref:DAAF9 N-terminal domain-containing protein n=1 Tax=Acrasis kona TaxID=1008807 RepID=A0AAW2ZL42_9EUKA
MNSTHLGDQAHHLYTSTDCRNRLRKVQNLCTSLEIGGMLFVAGLDGEDHLGSTKAINFLFSGISGVHVQAPILYQECFDDLVVLITDHSIKVLCNPTNIKLISNLTSTCENIELYSMDQVEYDTDKDAAEDFKIINFINMVQSLSVKHIGIPVTPTTKDPHGSRFEIEKWPLIQSYGLENYRTGQFFSMAYKVEKIYTHLEALYKVVDSQALKMTCSGNLSLFTKHWNDVLSNVDSYIDPLDKDANDSKNDLIRFGNQTEEVLLEPMTTYYEYALMQNSFLQDVITIDKCYRMSPSQVVDYSPRLLFGSHTTPTHESKSNIENTINKSNRPCPLFIMRAMDPMSPISCSRSYFLSTGKLQHDVVVKNKLIINKQDEEAVQLYTESIANHHLLLQSTYVRLCKLHVQLCEFIVGTHDQTISNLVELQQKARDLSALDVSVRVVDLDLTVQPKPPLQQLSDYGVVNLSLSVQIEEYTIEYADTVAYDRGVVGKSSCGYVNITHHIPMFTFWTGDYAEEVSIRDIKNLLFNRIKSQKFIHPVMGELLQNTDSNSVRLLFGVGNYSAEILIGDVNMLIFQRGIAALGKRLGVAILYFENLTHITFYEDDYNNLTAIMLEHDASFSFAPIVPQLDNNNNSLLLYLVHGSSIKFQFVTRILNEWRAWCQDKNVPFSTINISQLPSCYKKPFKCLLEQLKSSKNDPKSIHGIYQNAAQDLYNDRVEFGEFINERMQTRDYVV